MRFALGSQHYGKNIGDVNKTLCLMPSLLIIDRHGLLLLPLKVGFSEKHSTLGQWVASDRGH